MEMVGAAFKGLLSILALAIDGCILVWVLYNEMVERLPEYHDRRWLARSA